MTGCSNDERFLVLRCRATNFFDRAYVTEIDRDVASLQRGIDGVAEIALRDDVDLGIVFRQIANRLTHSTFRANERHAHARFHFDFSKASRVLRRRAWFASVISQSGKRTSLDIAPRQPRAVFTGTGFGSINKSLKSGNILRCKVSPVLKSPDSHMRTSAQTSAGN